MVVNPFLAVFGLMSWLGGMIFWIKRSQPVPALLVLILLPGVPFLIQYHCLDCGRTGILLRCHLHACPGVRERWRRMETHRWGWPRPGTQMVIWIWVILALALLIAVSWPRW